MGGCIPSNDEFRQRPKRDTSNPIQHIIDQHSIEALRQKWDMHELKTMEHKMLSLPSHNIGFKEFCSLFPKVRDFSNGTQTKIYHLFCYQGQKDLSREEIVNTLTLIRKVSKNTDFAPFLFYVYTSDQAHRCMLESQLTLFRQENEKFLSSIPPDNDSSLLSDGEEHGQSKENRNKSLGRDNASGMGKSRPQGSERPEESFQGSNKLGTSQASQGGPKERMLSFEQFRDQFEGYNLVAYQILFSWDLREEERELVQQLKREGLKINTNDKVYVTDYNWWLSWVQYAQQAYGLRIDFDQKAVQNFNSAKSRDRRDSVTRQNDSPTRRQDARSEGARPPGQIKNGCLLKQGKNRNELVPNLVQFDNYICLPERVWSKLVAIYHGGPPIERHYPRIYNSLILKARISEDGKFFYGLKRFTKTDNFRLQDVASARQLKWPAYYKYPGRNNWTRLPSEQAQHSQIFSSFRTYLVFVPPRIEERFLNEYNIQETSKGKVLRRRFKNFGSELNISVEGVLTKAEVTEILGRQTLRVAFVDQNGLSQQKSVAIDQKLEQLNPEVLDSEKKLNELPGLRNLGNTCYMNAVIQCLVRTPYFGPYLRKEDFGAQRKGEELLLLEVARLESDSHSYHTLDTINTKNFKRVVDLHCPFFEGNLQHDAQEFLICLLVRLSEEIRSKAEYGQSLEREKERKDKEKEKGDPKEVNKKIVKFFSGKTEAVTECLRCKNRNRMVEPFFTYSISLPEMKESEYSYFLVEFASRVASTVPVQHGITLDRKVTVEDFIREVARAHRKNPDCLVLYSVFNNEMLNRLEPKSWQEVGHHLNFNVKLVFYEVEHSLEPTYASYQKRALSDRSVKLELRQRIYASKTDDYKIPYLPFLLEVTDRTTWKDLTDRVDLIIAKLSRSAQEASNGSTARPHLDKVSSSGIRIDLQSSGVDMRKSSSHLNAARSSEQNYRLRVVRNDPSSQNYCFICKGELVPGKRSRGRPCRGQQCSFRTEAPLMEDQEFKNYSDSIAIVVDWEQSLPSGIPQSTSHPSLQQANTRAQGRKDLIEQLLVSSFNMRQTLDLRCEAKDCQFEQAERTERIILAPNILLLHLKRFRYEENRLVKLTNRVVYPHRLVLPGSKETYLLYGVVVHYGSGVGGHYVSIVRASGKWYCCDDQRVTLAEEGAEIDAGAYLLFYHKADFEPSLVCLSF